MKYFFCFLVSCALIGAALLHANAAAPPTLRVETGQLSGVTDANGVSSYKGIPFAAPPVGDLRWRAPQPAAKWEGVRKADRFGSACIQNIQHSRLPWSEPFMEQGTPSEDCLYINVWTAARTPADRRPVMVYFYGGGFNEGSASVAVYDGTQLARRGVVLVSFNYRVGALGFLSHPELSAESPHKTSGNYGLLDQIAALEWVHKNIAAFGGDPARVTIFGQSAGALSVYDLMQSPLAKGFFARAILESGPGLLPTAAFSTQDTLAAREVAGVKLAASKNAHLLAELRAAPATEFIGAPGRPFADGWVLPAPDAQTQKQTPVIVGMVADDLALETLPRDQKPTVAAYEEATKKKYGEKAAEALKFYPAASDAEVPAALKARGRDQARVSIALWAAKQLAVSPKVYTYYFDRAIPWPEHPEFGAFHTSEVPYVFETLDLTAHPVVDVDHRVSDEISSYWMNFAASGDPNGKGLAPWPAYSPKADTTMEIGEKTGAMPVAAAERLAFQKQFLQQQK